MTTADVLALVTAQLEAALGRTLPILPRSFLRVLAKVLAGVFVQLYKLADFITLQLFVSTASFTEITLLGKSLRPLVEWGRLVGVGDPDPAVAAQLTTRVTILNPSGNLPAGSQLLNSNTGVTYVTTATVALVGATVDVAIEAVADQSGGDGAGVIGNMDPSDVLPFANPLANVARDTVIQTLDVTGTDAQTEDDYRQEVIDRFQKRAQGGATADYNQWGLEVPGVAAIYPYRGDPHDVNVYVEAETTVDPDGIPPGAMLTAVSDSIEKDSLGLATRRPLGASVNVLAITRTSFDVEILGLDADTTANRDAATAAVQAYFLSRTPFVDGLTPAPRSDSITLTEITSELVLALAPLSATFTSVSFELSAGSVPLTIYTLGEGETAKAAAVTFV